MFENLEKIEENEKLHRQALHCERDDINVTSNAEFRLEELRSRLCKTRSTYMREISPSEITTGSISSTASLFDPVLSIDASSFDEESIMDHNLHSKPEARNFEGNIKNEYHRAVEDLRISVKAKEHAIRDSLIFTLIFLVAYVFIGVMFYSKWEGDWPVEQALLFIIYTMTTVGYGNYRVPKSRQSKIFTSVYVVIGIALTTVFFSEFFEYIVLKSVKARYRRDRVNIARKGRESFIRNKNGMSETRQKTMQSYLDSAIDNKYYIDVFIEGWRKVKNFFRHTNFGIFISDVLPPIFIILSGAVVLGSLEGWSVVNSVYFSVVSATTVGYGDMHPEKTSSVWFCIFWLPFSLYFMSKFLSNVNRVYRKIYVMHSNRIENCLRKNLYASTSENKNESQSDEKSTDLPVNISMSRHLRKTKSYLMENEIKSTPQDIVPGMLNTDLPDKSRPGLNIILRRNDKLSNEIKSEIEDPTDDSTVSQHLRMLVQERLALIMQYEIILKENSTQITSQRKQYDILSLRFPHMKGVADKWLIPLRAREALSIVTLDVLMSFGMEGLIEGKLFELPSEKFQRLFIPVMAAMEPSEIMETWLASTEILIENVQWKDDFINSRTTLDQEIDDRSLTETIMTLCTSIT